MTSYIDILLRKVADEGRAVPLIDSGDKALVRTREIAILTYVNAKYSGDFMLALDSEPEIVERWIVPNAKVAANHFKEDTIETHIEEMMHFFDRGIIKLPQKVFNDGLSIYHDPKGGCNSYTPQDF